MLRQARHHTVVEDDAVVAEHQAVAHMTGLQAGHVRNVEAVDEACGVGPRNFDLAERRAVEKPDRVADRRHLDRHRLLPIGRIER